MKMPPVLSKRDFARRYAEGEFGNRTATWPSIGVMLKEVGKPDNDTMYHIRNRETGGLTFYNVPGGDLELKWEDVMMAGHNPSNFYISEMAPTEHTLFQGELSYVEGVMTIFGSHVKKPMRDALKEKALTYKGITAVGMLNHYCDQNSQDQIDYLINTYDDHVIEFSVYSKRCGVDLLNTIIWEVRCGY